MRVIVAGMIAILSAAAAAVQIAAPAPHAGSLTPFGSPPVVSAGPGVGPVKPPVQQLLAWMPGAVTCDRMAVAPAVMRRPFTALVWPGADVARTITYRFRIDAAGRPLSITRDTAGYVPQSEDIAPSLAASRFPDGAARSDCAITYGARVTPIEQTPIADLISYSLNPMTGALPRAGWDRIMPAGTSCRAEPAPRILLRAYPDFARLPPTPGVRGWSMVGYDLDARGHPVRVRTVESTRNPALDAAAIRAVKASRFTPGAKTGCLYPYWQDPATVAAPPMPGRIDPVDPAARCAVGAWVYRPTPVYPPAWHRRRIEGWAIVAFDVAPWGDAGNVRVVASEPAAEFGQEAVRMLRGGRKPASTTGHVGCIERVAFVTKPRRRATDTTAPAPADPVQAYD